ncbi:hypothetical protein RUND412_011639, partial [Rhizina undulata]
MTTLDYVASLAVLVAYTFHQNLEHQQIVYHLHINNEYLSTALASASNYISELSSQIAYLLLEVYNSFRWLQSSTTPPIPSHFYASVTGVIYFYLPPPSLVTAKKTSPSKKSKQFTCNG